MPATTPKPAIYRATRIAVAAFSLCAVLFLAGAIALPASRTSPALAAPFASATEPSAAASESSETAKVSGTLQRIVRAIRATQTATSENVSSTDVPTEEKPANEPSAVTQAAIDQAVSTSTERILAGTAHFGTASPEEPAETPEPGAAFLACNLDLTVNDQVVATVNAETVRPWIVVEADGSAWVDDYALTNWVDGIEAVIDSVWATRSYLRPDGKWVTVSGGTYGWISNGAQLDQIVRDAVYNGTVGSCEVPMKQTATVFNPGGQDWGRYVDVDISEQYVRFYDWDGSLIWESPCITGIPDGVHETPTGVYAVTRKDTNQVLTGPYDPETDTYEYESFVQWWMPFIDNMVGLHDASWQPGFSSDAYLYRGSHGCVNLPVGNAYQLFCLIEVGDVVVTHY